MNSLKFLIKNTLYIVFCSLLFENLSKSQLSLSRSSFLEKSVVFAEGIYSKLMANNLVLCVKRTSNLMLFRETTSYIYIPNKENSIVTLQYIFTVLNRGYYRHRFELWLVWPSCCFFLVFTNVPCLITQNKRPNKTVTVRSRKGAELFTSAWHYRQQPTRNNDLHSRLSRAKGLAGTNALISSCTKNFL